MPDPTYYCAVSDLLIGDMVLSADVDEETYVAAAFNEINSRLGYLYKLPLEAIDVDHPILAAGLAVLKDINLKLASGRLIMAIASGGEDNAVNAYGESLVREAWATLMLVLGGQLPIVGAAPLDTDSGNVGGPATINADSESAVTAFESNFYGSQGYKPFPLKGVWTPGA